MAKVIATAVALSLTAASGAALAQGEPEECFDKGALDYTDCPAEPVTVIEAEPEPVDPWPGAYIGLHIGYGAGGSDGFFDDNDPVGEFEFDPIEPSGFAFGAQIGYLWRATSDVVVGVELDGTYFGHSDRVGILDTTGSNPNATDGAGFQFGETEINWLASLRARAGFTFDRIMPFATAGVGLVNYDFVLDDAGGGSGGGGAPGRAAFDDTAFAPVVGAGVEWLITDDVMIKFDGLYYFVNEDIDLDGAIPDADNDNGQGYELDDVYLLRAGVSLRF